MGMIYPTFIFIVIILEIIIFLKLIMLGRFSYLFSWAEGATNLGSLDWAPAPGPLLRLFPVRQGEWVGGVDGSVILERVPAAAHSMRVRVGPPALALLKAARISHILIVARNARVRTLPPPLHPLHCFVDFSGFVSEVVLIRD